MFISERIGKQDVMDKTRVAEAVNLLIDAPNYASLANEMTRIIDTWDTHPMVYGQRLSPLNAMVDIGLQNREAFERLLALVEDKRRITPGRTRRVEYQRDLMRERRARQTKALELQELLHGPLRGAARIQAIADLTERWRMAREAFIKDKGDLTWAERNAASGEFWDKIDRQLDSNLADARRKRA